MSNFDFSISISEREYSDHGGFAGEKITAVKADPSMTIQELVDAHLRINSDYDWIGTNERRPSGRKHLVIRAVID